MTTIYERSSFRKKQLQKVSMQLQHTVESLCNTDRSLTCFSLRMIGFNMKQTVVMQQLQYLVIPLQTCYTLHYWIKQ